MANMTDEEVLRKAKKIFGKQAEQMDIKKLRKGLEEMSTAEETKFLEEGLDAQKISTAIGELGSGKNKNPKKEGKGLKEGDSTDFGMLSVEAGIDNNPKPTQADRIAGATKNEKKKAKGGVRTAIAKIKKAKDGSRTGVRGTGAAKKGFRKARLS